MNDHKRVRMDLFNRCYMGKTFRHFKGGMYVVDCIGKHSESGELMVVYHLKDDPGAVCIRPLEMFFSPVDTAKYPDATQRDRFEKVDGNE